MGKLHVFRAYPNIQIPHPLVHKKWMDGTVSWARGIHRKTEEPLVLRSFPLPHDSCNEEMGIKMHIDLWWFILKKWGFDDIWWLLWGSRNGHLHHLNHLRLANLAMILILKYLEFNHRMDLTRLPGVLPSTMNKCRHGYGLMDMGILVNFGVPLDLHPCLLGYRPKGLLILACCKTPLGLSDTQRIWSDWGSA